MSQTILLIEDNPHIMKINRLTLVERGYSVLEASTVAEGRDLMNSECIDLIILDIILPDGNGLDFCRKVREVRNIPILFLTALGDSSDVVNGLVSGGDDYMTKPYDLDVLAARVDVLLRRNRQDVIQHIGSLELNTVSSRAYLCGEDLCLTHMEYSILEYLVKNREWYTSAEELYEKLWDMEVSGDVRTVWEHISRIRKKLNGKSSVAIVSGRGKGYRIADTKQML